VREQVEIAIGQMNRNQPHYKQVRAFYIHERPFTIESGLLTVNGKLKRDSIAAHLAAPISNMYSKKTA
jgi:long-subunit acyl-CoA synthetase (AMP-forming)